MSSSLDIKERLWHSKAQVYLFYFMDRSVIPRILRELNLNADSVANIYNYGSWVYGTNSPNSDRDLMIVTREASRVPLLFRDDWDYFHDFELHKLWNQYDVCVHSVENFEKLLEKNYLLAVECTFLPDEFKIKEEIDFRSIYLTKYHNILRLKQAAFYENNLALTMFDLNDESIYPARSIERDNIDESDKNYLFKNLFHGFRYLDFVEQLIQTKSIHDFKRVSHVLDEMKTIRDQHTDDETSMENVLAFVRAKSAEYKSKLDALVPTNVIKGTFEAHITFDCSYDTEQVIERLKKACEGTKFKLIFIDLQTAPGSKTKLQQLMTSSYHCGEYPTIVKQIEEQISQHFREFNILRTKVESLASNEGVPETDLDKKLFWNEQTNYFEFHYKVLVTKDTLTTLQNACRTYYISGLHLSHNAFKQCDGNEYHYIITMRVFDMGREHAFEKNNQVIEYLTKCNFSPLKIEREFVVYDSCIQLDEGWS